MNDATRIIRALRKLNKLFWRYRHEDIAKALLVERGIDRGLVQFCGEFLNDIAEFMPQDPWPECAVCGGESNAMNRAGVVYCSHKCRQKAYRDRIRDAKTARIGRAHVTQSKNVTGNALISEHPASRDEGPAPP